MKLLSKNSLSATQQIYTIHQISLDGLLSIVVDIERNFQSVKSATGTTVPSIGRHSRNNSSIDKIVLESQTDLNATTSGGEESSTIENIQNIIKNDSKAATQHADGNEHCRGSQVITHVQLAQIKNKKRVSIAKSCEPEHRPIATKSNRSLFSDFNARHRAVQSTTGKGHSISSRKQLFEC